MTSVHREVKLQRELGLFSAVCLIVNVTLGEHKSPRCSLMIHQRTLKPSAAQLELFSWSAIQNFFPTTQTYPASTVYTTLYYTHPFKKRKWSFHMIYEYDTTAKYTWRSANRSVTTAAARPKIVLRGRYWIVHGRYNFIVFLFFSIFYFVKRYSIDCGPILKIRYRSYHIKRCDRLSKKEHYILGLKILYFTYLLIRCYTMFTFEMYY